MPRVQDALAETRRLVVLESAPQKARGKDNSRLRRIWYGTEYCLNVGWEMVKIVFAICTTLAAWGAAALVGLAIIKWAVEELSR